MEAGQPDDGTARVRPPVRGEQPGERRNEVRAAGVVDLAGQFLALRGIGDDPQLVAQPLHRRPGDRDRPFQGVHRGRVSELVAHGGEQPVLRPDRLGADVEQQEVAGAVGVLGLAGGKADLAHRRGLLVAEVAGQQHRPAERPVRAGQPVAGRICGRPDSRQHLARYAEQRQQLVIPVQGGQVHQHGAAGVSRVSDVHAAVGPAGQVPQQPAVDGAEQRVARLGGRPGAVDVLQDPLQLAAGEVGGRRQPGPLPDQLAAPVPVQRGGDRVGAGVLPDDRVAVGLAGPPVPHHRGLALVGDADRGQVTGPQPGPAQAGFDDLAGARPDLRRVMLHPARPGHDLVVL